MRNVGGRVRERREEETERDYKNEKRNKFELGLMTEK